MALAVSTTRSILHGVPSTFIFSSCRTIHCTRPLWKMARLTSLEKMANKQVKIMSKMTQRSIEKVKEKRLNVNNPMGNYNDKAPPSIPSSANYMREAEPRRVKQLEHLFLEHITELMATDEFTRDLAGFSVEIISVDYIRQMNKINILWLPKSSEEEDQLLHERLKTLAPRLQHALARSVGNVPRLEFVRDVATLRLRELKATFDNLDTGPAEEDSLSDVLEVTIEGNPSTGLSVKVTDDGFHLNQVPEKRTDVGGIDRRALLEELNSSPKATFKQRERA